MYHHSCSVCEGVTWSEWILMWVYYIVAVAALALWPFPSPWGGGGSKHARPVLSSYSHQIPLLCGAPSSDDLCQRGREVHEYCVDPPMLCSGDTNGEHIVQPWGVAPPQPECCHPPYEDPLRTQAKYWASTRYLGCHSQQASLRIGIWEGFQEFLIACMNPWNVSNLLEVEDLARRERVLVAFPPSSVRKRCHEGVREDPFNQLKAVCSISQENGQL